MPALTHDFDLGALRLRTGQGRRLELEVDLDALALGGQRYSCDPARTPVILDISRMSGSGYALRLCFQTALSGPCMRCLGHAQVSIAIDAREIDQPGGGEELSSPYVDHEVLDLCAWARDSFALALPARVLCRADCAGLCPVCAADLNQAGPDHHHERVPDPRWAKLRELKLE